MKVQRPISVVLLSLMALISVGSSECEYNPAEKRDRELVQEQQTQYAIGQPVPVFDWSLERETVIQLYQWRNRHVATYSVWRGEQGMIEGDCPSIGYPIPYDTSLTNPLQSYYTSAGSTTIEQAEPNGLFASKNTSATWVRCVYEVDGEQLEAPVYVETRVTAYPFPVEVDYTTNRVTPMQGQRPTVTIEHPNPPQN